MNIVPGVIPEKDDEEQDASPASLIEPARATRVEPPQRLPNFVSTQNQTLLTSCVACGRDIAKEAASCPGCGAPNKWVHPEIMRFLEALRNTSTFNRIPRFKVDWDKYFLVGVDERSQQNAENTQGLLSGFGLWTPLTLNGLFLQTCFHATTSTLIQSSQADVKKFYIDFSTSPALWATTDDRHWADVLQFFGLKEDTSIQRPLN